MTLQMYLGLLPTPRSTVAPFAGWKSYLVQGRGEWSAYQETYLRSPDGSWVNDGPADSSPSISRASGTVGLRIDTNGLAPRLSDATSSNPLGLDSSNPWKQWFADIELRRLLWQDVERTMPDMHFFRDVQVQRTMVNLLHVWSRLNEGVGYRQGMHEVLGYVLLVVNRDALPAAAEVAVDPSAEMMHLILSDNYIEHDAWTLFSALMKYASAFYDSTPSVPMEITRASVSGIGSERDRVTLIQPVVAQSIRICDSILQKVDPELFNKLEVLQIEPQIWGIRWLRLLCGREFAPLLVLQLWDVLFAEDATLRLIDHICVAMLIRIRNRLLTSDYSDALQLLLRYPSEVVPDTVQLGQQAIQLRDDPTPRSAAAIHQENIMNGLGELVDALPSLNDASTQRLPAHRRAESAGPAVLRRSIPASLASKSGLVGDIAQNVFERAEALGLNKALGDLRRNVEQYHASFSTAASASASPQIMRAPPSKSNMASIISMAADILESEQVTRHATAIHALRHVAGVLGGSISEVDSSFLAALRPLSPSPRSSPIIPSSSSSSTPPTSVASPPFPPKPPGQSAAPVRPSPTLLLSSRHDRPSTNLPRVPYSHWNPQPPVRTPSPVSEPESVSMNEVGRSRSIDRAFDPLGAM